MIRTGFIKGKLLAIKKQYTFETLRNFHKNKTIIIDHHENKSIKILSLATSEVFLKKFIDEVNQKNLKEHINLLFRLNHRLYLVSQDENEQCIIKLVFTNNKQLHIFSPNNQSEKITDEILDSINSTVINIRHNI